MSTDANQSPFLNFDATSYKPLYLNFQSFVAAFTPTDLRSRHSLTLYGIPCFRYRHTCFDCVAGNNGTTSFGFTDDGSDNIGFDTDLVEKDPVTGAYTGNDFDAANATGDINSEALRAAVTTHRTKSVVPVRGSMYATFIHPEVSHDIRRETDPAGWRQPHTYVDTTELYVGEIGTWEGLIFIETPFCRKTDNAGTDVYSTYVFGREALAEAVAEEPHLVVNGNLGQDVFNRKTSVGWYGILGHSIFRPEPLIQIGSTSSITDVTA